MDNRRSGNRTRLWLAIGVVCSFLVLAQPLADDGNSDPDTDAVTMLRDEAVRLARAGQFDQALEMLDALRSGHPEDPSLLYDQTSVLFWAGRFQAVLQHVAEIDPEIAPGYVLNAVARSARNTQSFDLATEWYGYALAADHSSVDARMGLAMSRSDAGLPRLARETLEAVSPEARVTTAVLIPSAYLHHNDQAYLQAISEYDAILRIDPDHYGALRGKAQALRALLLPRQALTLAEQHPGILNDRELIRVEVDAYALDLRDAIESPDPRDRFERIEATLDRIDQRMTGEPTDSELARLLRYDRIVGLVAAGRRDEAVIEYERAIGDGEQPPIFVYTSIGAAYLALRQPRLAEQALRQGESIDPDDAELQIELFFALIALERFNEAFELIDTLAAKLETVRQLPGSSVAKPNPVRMYVEIIAAVGRAYPDQLADAQHRLEQLLAQAPNNTQLRYELANVYRWRGWNRRAEKQYAQVLGLRPAADVSIRAANAENQLDLGRPPPARATLDDLIGNSPTAVAVWDLDRRWLIHNDSQLLIDARYGNSSGEVFGSEQYQINGWWFSKPIYYDYRIYARTFDSWARFDDGTDVRRRMAAGFDYRKGPLRILGEINGDRWEFDSPGVAGRVDWRITDHWIVGGLVEFDSYATQLRADRVGIESNLFGAEMTYRGSESWFVTVTLAFQPYDDGNDRSGGAVDGRYRLYNGYKYKLDGYANVELSSSTESDLPYYSPERAAEGTIGITNIWRQYRFYDRSVTHRLSADIGIYDQKGFGSDTIWTLDYQLLWSVNARWALKFGVQQNRRVYDGGPEDSTFWTFGLDGRL